MQPRWSVLWSWLWAALLVACVSEASPEPGMLLPPTAIAPAASPSVVQAQTPLLPTPTPIASSPPPLSPSPTPSASSPPSTTRAPATIAPSLLSPTPTTTIPNPSQVPTPLKTVSVTATPTLAVGLAATPAGTPAGTCECPKRGAGAPDHSVPAGYKLVSYGCVLNYIMTDWWPQNLFDDEATYAKIEGNDETALVYTSSDTHVVNYVMQCHIVLGWTFQPIAATPSPRTTATPSGDLYRVWQLPSIEHAGASVAKSLGIATGPEQAVWMSEASIDSLHPPKPLQMHDHIFRRLDNNQVYILHAVGLRGRFWETAPGLSVQSGEQTFLGTIQHYQLTQTCAYRTQCVQSGLVIWSPIWRRADTGAYISDNSVNILYGDGYGESFDSTQGWIAYACPQKSGDLDVCAVKSDGNAQIRLSSSPARDWFPHWSLDGTRFIFASERDGAEQIYLWQANSVKRLTSLAGPNTAPDWSPDEKRIAFASTQGGNSDIYVMNFDGTGQPTNLTRDPAGDFNPAWSPDGQRIAFNSNRGGMGRIYVMNSNGTSVKQLTDGRSDANPVWSPDGKRIAFVAFYGYGNYEIEVMNADGTNRHRLTDSSEPETNPVWSPDGTQIAYCRNEQFVNHIYLMNADGSNEHLLGQGIEGCPYSWR